MYPQWNLVAKSGTELGPADLSSDIPTPTQWHLVAKTGTDLGPVDLSSDVPTAVSSDQEWY